ncbi:Calsyntenin-2 [Liparis tanakae]|uniref:Calsyntenin-2 n=1 Tax=Liparis tanakae TaxID=230148 RepID=A0A4Z2IGG6_9TELE|nr:Calsyntenin-2 [Liparis tanakae]
MSMKSILLELFGSSQCHSRVDCYCGAVGRHMVPILMLQREAVYSEITGTFNKHKPWIETSYHGVITENMDTVLLDPPLVALDKDAPVPYAVARQGLSILTGQLDSNLRICLVPFALFI